MNYLFIPYYNEDSPEFKESLKYVNGFRIIRRDRKRDKIYWTKAVNDFIRDLRNYRGTKDDDIICVMNNDISFDENLFIEGSQVKKGQVYIPEGVEINWERKGFTVNQSHLRDPKFIHTFAGRCFFMTYGDFVNSKFSSLLPHYLSDYDYGIRMIKKGLKPIIMKSNIKHIGGKEWNKRFELINPENPVFWTIFLLKHLNIYTPLNILKAWVKVPRREDNKLTREIYKGLIENEMKKREGEV